jgi:uncharacterized membrane protein
MRVLAALLLLVGSGSPALAKIKFCDTFKYDLHIAIAYETSDGFVSEGWTGVKAGACVEDDDYASLTSFYYHAETDAIPVGKGKSTTWDWGNRRAFSVLNKPFKITHAEFKAEGGRLAEFTGPETLPSAAIEATISLAEGSSTVSIPGK